MKTATTDLSDAHPEAQVADPVFKDYGGTLAFHGPAKTLKVFEDNALVRATLETPGEGRVLVVDGGGSMRCALVGGNLGQLAIKNRWAGLLVYGCVRDSEELAGQAVGIKALATHPKKSEKGAHSARQDVAVRFAGLIIKPGSWVYADRDGVVVSENAIHA